MEGDAMKNKALILTILYFLILVMAPGYSIYRYYDILRTGETYNIEIMAYDPYDPFRGRYVAIRPAMRELWWNPEDIQLIKDADDFVVDVVWGADPNAVGYVRRLVIERYYLNERVAPLVEERQMRAVAGQDLIHVVVKVKNGGYAIEGLFINGIAAEDYFR